MFGYHKAKREKKKAKKEKAFVEKEKEEIKQQKPAAMREKQQYEDESIDEKTQKAKERRQQARKEGREYGLDFINQDIQGLDPQKRKALQYEAFRNIDRSAQTANRHLLGDQSKRGVVGKGGVGYAQQRDLQRMAGDSRGQVNRDLDKLDSDLQMKKLGALFSAEQGEATQSQLDRQSAADELYLNDERRRQRAFEDRVNDMLFNRL